MSPAAQWLCEQLEVRTTLKRIESRGTVRLLLKSAGLDVHSVVSSCLAVATRSLLIRQLEKLRIADAETLCKRLAEDLIQWSSDAEDPQDDAADIFDRLGRTGRKSA